jgi:hypothetical protein
MRFESASGPPACNGGNGGNGDLTFTIHDGDAGAGAR